MFTIMYTKIQRCNSDTGKQPYFCSQLYSFFFLSFFFFFLSLSCFASVFLKPFRVVVSLNLILVAAGLSLLLCLLLSSSLLLFYDSTLRQSANSSKAVIYKHCLMIIRPDITVLFDWA